MLWSDVQGNRDNASALWSDVQGVWVEPRVLIVMKRAGGLGPRDNNVVRCA